MSSRSSYSTPEIHHYSSSPSSSSNRSRASSSDSRTSNGTRRSEDNRAIMTETTDQYLARTEGRTVFHRVPENERHIMTTTRYDNDHLLVHHHNAGTKDPRAPRSGEVSYEETRSRREEDREIRRREAAKRQQKP